MPESGANIGLPPQRILLLKLELQTFQPQKMAAGMRDHYEAGPSSGVGVVGGAGVQPARANTNSKTNATASDCLVTLLTRDCPPKYRPQTS
jgi:hypothetical protein